MNQFLSNIKLEELQGDQLWNIEHYENSSTDEFSSGNVSSAQSTTENEDHNQMIINNNAMSGESEYVPGTFEGPEKTMEVVFIQGEGKLKGLRNLTREQLDILCMKARCTILSKTSSNYVDAYVLSESSLFVYEYRYIMKTCGTTTLLRCLSSLMGFADKLDMKLSWVGYSRKNFNFPTAQQFPHGNFSDEMTYIDTHENLQNRMVGTGYVLGPVTGDHWFVYFANGLIGKTSTSTDLVTSNSKSKSTDYETSSCASSSSSVGDCSSEIDVNKDDIITTTSSKSSAGLFVDEIFHRNCNSPPALRKSDAFVFSPHPCTHNSSSSGSNQLSSSLYRTVNMMMFDMDPTVASIFYLGENGFTGKEMTMKAQIATLCPGATIDEAAFSPCGYSMNAVLHNAYFTIHITPEPQCSYVSFETNTSLESYDSLVRNVLSIFRPKRFVLTMFGIEAAMDSVKSLPTNNRGFEVPVMKGFYSRTSSTSTYIEQQKQLCIMSCYSFHCIINHNEMMNASASLSTTTSIVHPMINNTQSSSKLLLDRGDSPPLNSSEIPFRRSRSYTMF